MSSWSSETIFQDYHGKITALLLLLAVNFTPVGHTWILTCWWPVFKYAASNINAFLCMIFGVVLPGPELNSILEQGEGFLPTQDVL